MIPVTAMPAMPAIAAMPDAAALGESPPDVALPAEDAPHADEIREMARLAAAAAVLLLIFALGSVVLALETGDRASAAAGVVQVTIFVALICGRRQLMLGRSDRGVVVIIGATLVACLVMATIPPPVPALAAAPILAVAFALSVLHGRNLKAALLAAWIVSLITAIIVEVTPASPDLPATVAATERITTFAALVGLTAFVLYRHRRRLEAAMASVRTVGIALRKSEARYRTVVEEVREVIFRIDADGRCQFLNRAWEELTGHRVVDSLGLPIIDFIDAADRERYADAVRRATHGARGDYRGEHRLVASHGAETWVRVHARPILDDAGRFSGMSGTLSDITKAKHAEQALIREHALLEALMDSTPDHIYFKDADSRFTMVNAAVARSLGLDDPAQAVGRTDFDFFPEEEARPVFEAEQEIMRSRMPVVGLVEKETWPDGRETWSSTTKLVRTDPEGNVLGTFGISRDITARVRAEADVRQLNEKLEHRVAARTAELAAANKELETFTYSVSHDLRAPLRAINGFSEILLRRHRDALDEQGRHYLDTIVASSEEMGVLIEALLDYSRMGRGIVRAEPVPLRPLVIRLRATFDERIDAAGATLEVVEPLAVPVGDPVLLERILANLVDNALTYRRAGVAPRVTLSSIAQGATVTLAVADNGLGIAPDQHERIFEVFARLHGDDEYAGTGIGLSIVRRAARLMGSEVLVESTVGAGSTFSLELPAAGEYADV